MDVLPISGLILLPLTVGIFCFSSYLAEWTIVVAVLQGAALVNVRGGFAVGLSPYFFALALMSLELVPQWLSGRVRLAVDESTRAQTRTLAFFTAWCALSAFILPLLFDGLPVDSPREGVDRAYYTRLPLHWTFSNAGQAGYMMLNFMLIVCLLQVSTQHGRVKRLAHAFSWSGMLVVTVGAYQILCHLLGLSFPAWLFNSNAVWSELSNQSIGDGLYRTTATFVEPSATASFLAAWSIFELSLAIGGQPQTGRHWLCAGLGDLMLVATASTTGYAVGAVLWIVMAWKCISTVLRYGVINTRATVATLCLGSAALLAVVLIPDAKFVVEAVVLNKGESLSAIHRTSTFSRAIAVFIASYGLGVGLGSNRAMSAAFYVLSNLGLPGIILFVWALFQLHGIVRKQLHFSSHNPTLNVYLRAFGFAFIANGFALLISGAEISQPHLWILWGLLLATAACARFEGECARQETERLWATEQVMFAAHSMAMSGADLRWSLTRAGSVK